MIVLIERGRLGNQLFQYAALKTWCQREALWLVGFDELHAVFGGIDARQVLGRKAFVGRLIRRLRPRIDDWLLRSGLLPTVAESVQRDKIVIETKAGLLRGPAYAITSYFQSESAFSAEVVATLQLKRSLVDRADRLVRELGCRDRPLIFVHVRRGDYGSWPSSEHPAVLPSSWYRRAIAEMRSRLTNPFFLYVTDDVAYVRREFADVPDAHFSEADEAADFALMCACDGGILSASSFSWWAAYFVARRSTRAALIAPLYWAGHRQRRWYPPAIETSFLEYRPVWTNEPRTAGR